MFKRIIEQIKFTFKLKEQEKTNASLDDYLCPICLDILIEPVDMPCKHEICLKCFDTMLLTNQSNDRLNRCPMCRQCISTWARTARINNSVINLNKWKQIQELFPKEVKNRLEGKPSEPIEDLMPTVKKQQENVPNVNDYVEIQRLLITTPIEEPRLVFNENTNNLILPEANNNFATPLPVTQERTRRSKVKQEINEEFTRITRSRSIRLGTISSINAQSVETRRPIKRLTTLRR
jgi:hypothetical protein